MNKDCFDLIVIGSGPGGYVAAIRAAQLGMSVAIVDKRGKPGGACLNEGCIPSKALLESSGLFAKARDQFISHGIYLNNLHFNLSEMMKRKDDVVSKLREGIAYLFKLNRIAVFTGSARLTDSKTDGLHSIQISPSDSVSDNTVSTSEIKNSATDLILRGSRIIFATGSQPNGLPGIEFDGKVIVSAREALAFDSVPGRLVVAGGGFIGLEMASVWSRLGSQVTVIEKQSSLLTSMDRQVSEAIYRSLRKQGIAFKLGTDILKMKKELRASVISYVCDKVQEEIECDCLLVAAGRMPVLENTGLIEAGVELDCKGRVVVDLDFKTSVEGIYAIGDLVPGPMLAHKASEEAVICVDRMNGAKSEIKYENIPGVVYTTPEGASIGRTEEQLSVMNIEYRIGRCNFMANGRARCISETDGFVKILVENKSGKLIGVHVVGPHSSELIAEAAVVMSMNGTAQDVAKTCHAHPTLSEVFREAAIDAIKHV